MFGKETIKPFVGVVGEGMTNRFTASDSLSSNQKWLAFRNGNTCNSTELPVWIVLHCRHWPNVLILEILHAFSCQSGYWNWEYSLDQFQNKSPKSDWLLLSKFLMKKNIYILKLGFKKKVPKYAFTVTFRKMHVFQNWRNQCKGIADSFEIIADVRSFSEQ